MRRSKRTECGSAKSSAKAAWYASRDMNDPLPVTTTNPGSRSAANVFESPAAMAALEAARDARMESSSAAVCARQATADIERSAQSAMTFMCGVYSMHGTGSIPRFLNQQSHQHGPRLSPSFPRSEGGDGFPSSSLEVAGQNNASSAGTTLRPQGAYRQAASRREPNPHPRDRPPGRVRTIADAPTRRSSPEVANVTTFLLSFGLSTTFALSITVGIIVSCLNGSKTDGTMDAQTSYREVRNINGQEKAQA